MIKNVYGTVNHSLIPMTVTASKIETINMVTVFILNRGKYEVLETHGAKL